jgi:hypothetical protein
MRAWFLDTTLELNFSAFGVAVSFESMARPMVMG